MIGGGINLQRRTLILHGIGVGTISAGFLSPLLFASDAVAQESPNLLDATNMQRKSRRLRPVRYEPRLGLMARQMADAIARGRTGGIPIEEVEAQARLQGYAFRRLGYLMSVGQAPAPMQVEGWIEDSRPDEGIMDPGYREIGTALVDGRKLQGAGSDMVWVVLLAEPTRPAPSGWGRDVLRYINEFRIKKDLEPLKMNSLLNRAALAHARDMAMRDYFAHDSPEGETAGGRANRAGYRFQYWRQTLAAGPETARAVALGWMKSKDGQREAILDPLMKEAGVGYMFLPQDVGRINAVHYWSMTLASPR